MSFAWNRASSAHRSRHRRAINLARGFPANHSTTNMPKSDFGLDALAALEQNDAHELIKIFRKSGAGAINATVQGDMYAGSGPPLAG